MHVLLGLHQELTAAPSVTARAWQVGTEKEKPAILRASRVRKITGALGGRGKSGVWRTLLQRPGVRSRATASACRGMLVPTEESLARCVRPTPSAKVAKLLLVQHIQSHRLGARARRTATVRQATTAKHKVSTVSSALQEASAALAQVSKHARLIPRQLLEALRELNAFAAADTT